MPNVATSLPMTRRRVLQVGTLGLTGLTLASALRAEETKRLKSESSVIDPPRAKACLLIYLDGVPSAIDLFD